MKKFFTLIAIAMTATCAMAENYSLKLTTSGAKTNQWDNQAIVNFPTPLEKGKKYTMTMELKGDAVELKEADWGAIGLQFVFQDNNSENRDQWGGPADLQYGANFTTTEDWSDLVDLNGNPVTTDGNFPYSRVALNLGLLGGTIYIDNMKFIDEDGAEAFCITFDTEDEQKLVNAGSCEAEFFSDSAPVIDDYMIKVDVDGIKENNYESQIMVSIPTLEVGKHYGIVASFRSSEPEAEVAAVIEDNNSENKDQWGNSADLAYSAAFKATDTWSQCEAIWSYQDEEGNWHPGTDGKYPYNRIIFQLGHMTGTLYIDNIKIIEISEEGGKQVVDFKEGITGIAEKRGYHNHVTIGKAASDVPEFDDPVYEIPTTAISNVAVDSAKAQKALKNGQIVITRGAKAYNAVGQEL